MRMDFKSLNKIKEKYGVDTLWSFSRFDNYRNSHYEYFLKYILHATPKNKTDSAYAPIGGAVHDILEKFYTGVISYEEMIDEFEDVWSVNIDTLGFAFNKGDNDKNSNIQNKYYKDLQHFFTHYIPISKKVQCEQFLLAKITDDILFQGYGDCIFKDGEDYYIEDYKTSTIYSGKAINDHAAQLILYAVALSQMGVPKGGIKCRWNFLKYVTVDYAQVNGTIKSTNVERCTLGEKMTSKAKVWLKKLGYENQIDELLEDMIRTNSLDCLPDDVKEKFLVKDCYVYVDNIFEKYGTLKEEIIETIHEINDKTKEYNSTKDEGVFWDDDDTCKRQSYYFSNLSEFSIEQLKPYAEYLKKLEQEKEDPLGMGNILNKNKANDDSEDDMSWLDSLI